MWTQVVREGSGRSGKVEHRTVTQVEMRVDTNWLMVSIWWLFWQFTFLH